MKLDTEMKKAIRAILSEEKIDTVGFLAFDDCTVTLERRLVYLPEGVRSVIVFALPYALSEDVISDGSDRNISLYAVPRDYHLYVSELSERVIPRLKADFPTEEFYLCADTSPIDEREAALIAGIGILGENSLVITEKYSSFVFIAEIFTTLELESEKRPIERCEGCGACIRACPSRDECLSFITQKKGELSQKEILLVKKNGCAWGCDICQTVCPHSQNVCSTPIDFFIENRMKKITINELSALSECEFKKRAYSWRGRKTIERNLRIMEIKKVLFIGNSYTYYNDMPEMFGKIAAANGRVLEVESVTRGGWTLKQHSDPEDICGSEVSEKLKNNSYDAVVLQDHSMTAVETPEEFGKAVEKLSLMIKENGGTPVLYQTWGRREGSPDLDYVGHTTESMEELIYKLYTGAGKENGALVATVGRVFLSLQGKNSLELYDPDKTHPSYQGSYTAALTIYKTIFAEPARERLASAASVMGDEAEELIRTTVAEL